MGTLAARTRRLRLPPLVQLVPQILLAPAIPLAPKRAQNHYPLQNIKTADESKQE